MLGSVIVGTLAGIAMFFWVLHLGGGILNAILAYGMVGSCVTLVVSLISFRPFIRLVFSIKSAFFVIGDEATDRDA